SFFAYDQNFLGGVTVAAGPFSSTAHADIVTGAGPGGSPHVRVFNGQTGAIIHEFMAYDEAFRGGVFVSDPDLRGTGTDDIVTGAGAGGGPHVRGWNGGRLAELTGHYAYDPFTRPLGPFVSATNNQNDTTPPTVTIT